MCDSITHRLVSLFHHIFVKCLSIKANANNCCLLISMLMQIQLNFFETLWVGVKNSLKRMSHTLFFNYSNLSSIFFKFLVSNAWVIMTKKKIRCV